MARYGEDRRPPAPAPGARVESGRGLAHLAAHRPEAPVQVSSAESLHARPVPTEEAAPALPPAGRRGGRAGDPPPDEDARPSEPSPRPAAERTDRPGGAARLRRSLATRSALRRAVRIQTVLGRPGGLEVDRGL